MKILCVTSSPAPEQVVQLDALRRALCEQGHQVLVAAPVEGDHVLALDPKSLEDSEALGVQLESFIAAHEIKALYLSPDATLPVAWLTAMKHQIPYSIIEGSPSEPSLEAFLQGIVAPLAQNAGAISADPTFAACTQALLLQSMEIGRLKDKLRESQEALARQEGEVSSLYSALSAVQTGLPWILNDRFQRLRQAILPPKSVGGKLWSLSVTTAKTLLSEGPAGVVRKTRTKLGRKLAKTSFVRRRHEQQLQQILASSTYKGVVIYPPTVDWGWMFQRPHHLVSQFAKEGYLCFFVSPQTRGDRIEGFQKVRENLYLCSDMSLLYGVESPIFLVSWTEQAFHIDHLKNPKVVYDYLDALEVSSTGDVSVEKIALHERLLARADVVVATARKLFDETKPMREDVCLVPNAVQPLDFAVEPGAPVPADLAPILASSRPIIGYYGAMAKWFDYDLLEYAARQMSEAEFVLLGPDYDGTIKRLASLPNIHYLGLKDYQGLKHYLHAFDVAIIPFRINEITRATSPVKLFEYMAGGKPIVSTALNEAYHYQSVLIGENPRAFVAKLKEALDKAKDPEYIALLRQEMAENTWEQRVLAILHALEAKEASRSLIHR